MTRCRTMVGLLLFPALTLWLTAQDVRTAKLTDVTALPQVLNFEDQQTEGAPAGWASSPAETVFTDSKTVHSGHWSARLERKTDSPGQFTTLHRAISMNFSGKTIQLRGFLRLEDVTGFAGLWMREDGESDTLAFDNMQDLALKGTSDWREFTITLPLQEEGRKLFFGALLVGSGKLWVDDLQLIVDGKPVWQAPHAERLPTVLDLDHQFDAGSAVKLTSLSPVQIQNLATLGRVWGFLKYHHPLVVAGKFHWDYELFRILPKIIEAPNRDAANAAMQKWVVGLGEVPPCGPCAVLKEDDLYLRPDVKWIEDQSLLGATLSRQLQFIYRNRSTKGAQFYVSLRASINNPTFSHELPYSQIKFPDAGFQLLAVYRFWNIIQYWSPYRDLVQEDWNHVLAEFIPKVALAGSAEQYERAMFALIARAHDGHANLWNSVTAQPPVGQCELPVILRFIENRMVVTGYATPNAAKDSGFALGDAMTELDGVSVSRLVENWKPYYPASNDAARMRDIARSMTRGSCGETNVRVLRGSEQISLKPERVKPDAGSGPVYGDDLPGPTFRLLSKDVAYLKLSSVKAADAPRYVNEAAGTKALIIDIRNYPSEFVVFALGSLLVPAETQFVRFTSGDLVTPGAFHWNPPLSISPEKPHYSGKLVILVDEFSMSQSEYTAMAFRSVPGALVVGSTTSGADGNVSPFSLPGHLNTMISGIGVFYPDEKPTQRIGIIPDIVAKPTIAGVRDGTDEVLETALRQVLGDKIAAEELRKMAAVR